MEIEGLVRYWFEFDLTDHEPQPPAGRIDLDGGTAAYRLLGRGAGVTGYDEADCLRLLGDALDGDLPFVVRSERNPTIGESFASQIGNVTWRGVWFPPLNLSGPIKG